MRLGDRIDLKDHFMQKKLVNYANFIQEGKYEIALASQFNNKNKNLASFNLNGMLYKHSPVEIKAAKLPIYALMELIAYNETVSVKIPDSMLELKVLDEYDFNFLINDYGNEFMIVFHCVHSLFIIENKTEVEIYEYLKNQGVFVSIFFEYLESFCIKNGYRPPIHISSEKKAHIRKIDWLSKELQLCIQKPEEFSLFRIFYLWEQYNLLLDRIIPGIKLLESNINIIKETAKGITFLEHYHQYKYELESKV